MADHFLHTGFVGMQQHNILYHKHLNIIASDRYRNIDDSEHSHLKNKLFRAHSAGILPCLNDIKHYVSMPYR
jgi:hypothetical protein